MAAVTVACAARTELGVVTAVSDASGDSMLGADDGVGDAANLDAHVNDGAFGVDAQGDAIEECVAIDGECTTDSDCCGTFCGFHNRCGVPAPPYGSPVPP